MVALLRVILCATSLSHLASGDSINLVLANDSCSQCQGLIYWPIGEEVLQKLCVCVQLEAVGTGATRTRLEWKWEERKGWCSASTTFKNWCFVQHLSQKRWEKEDEKGSVWHGTGGHGASCNVALQAASQTLEKCSPLPDISCGLCPGSEEGFTVWEANTCWSLCLSAWMWLKGILSAGTTL